jgi:hypothetical protein
LQGRVKGDGVDRSHLLPASNVTKFGVEVRKAVDQLLSLQTLLQTNERTGHEPPPRGDLNSMFNETLEPIYNSERHLFPPDMDRLEISSSYKVFRMLRRSSDSRAIDEGVDKMDINIVNWWRRVKAGGGRNPVMDMMMHYADL